MSLLISITYYLTVYAGSTVYIVGFLSSLMNIGMLYSNRNSPCTFLSIYSSIVDCFALNIGLLTRVLATRFQFDPALSNVVWCKIRTYGLRVSTVLSVYLVCLTAVDQFFVICRSVRWRQRSNMSYMRRLAILITCFIAMEGLPYLIIGEIIRTPNSTSCTPMYNQIMAKYALYFNVPILFGIIPLSILISMGLLIYHKLNHREHLRQAQRTLTLIILCRIVLVVLSCTPYASYFIYSAIVSLVEPVRSVERLAVENFFFSIAGISLYLTYSTSFFVHYFLSATYRTQLAQLFRRHHQVNNINVSQPTPINVTRSNQTRS